MGRLLRRGLSIHRLDRVLAALVVATAILATPAQTSAHAGVVRTSPADRERLPTSPPAFVVEFTEPVGVDPSGVRLVDAGGRSIDLEAVTADGALITQPLPVLADGWYLASWTVVSSDGHIVHGAIAFAVGDATGPPPSVSAADPGAALLATVRAVGDLGLLVAAGGVAAWLVLGATSVRVRRLAIAAALVGASGGIGVAGLTVAAGGQAALTGVAFGAALIRAGLLVVVAAAARRRAGPLAGVLAAGALATTVAGGHPSAGVVTAGLLLAHLAAAAVWLGAAPAVLLVLRDSVTPDAEALRVVRRFSKAATVTLVIAVGGGSLLAWLLTDGRLEGLDPRYMTFLAVKVAMVAAAGLLGAVARRRLAAGTAGRVGLRRLFLFDSVTLTVVVGLSAGLTVGPPRPVVPDDRIHLGHCSMETGQRVVNLSLVPARVGDNEVFLDGAGALERAVLELRRPGDAGAIEIDLGPNGQQRSGSGSVPVAGIWNVVVLISRDLFTEERLACRLRVGP
jgi:copper transport protein